MCGFRKTMASSALAASPAPAYEKTLRTRFMAA